MRKPKKVKKISKAKLLKRLKNQALKLWAEAVKAKANNRCQVRGCEITEKLNAHHIESKYNCRALKFDHRNGLCLCPGHHKFKQDSAHKSFCFVLELLTANDIEYLTAHRMHPVEFTIEYLTARIEELQAVIKQKEKENGRKDNAAIRNDAGTPEGNTAVPAAQSVS